MKAISGLEPVASGRITFDGSDITTLAAHKRVARGIAQSPEGRQIFPDQSVRDNLMLGAYHRGLGAPQLAEDIDAHYRDFSRDCASAAISWPEPCPAANSRCWRSRAR